MSNTETSRRPLGNDRADIVLTASTEDLQQFVLDPAEDKEAFPEMGKWSRV